MSELQDVTPLDEGSLSRSSLDLPFDGNCDMWAADTTYIDCSGVQDTPQLDEGYRACGFPTSGYISPQHLMIDSLTAEDLGAMDPDSWKHVIGTDREIRQEPFDVLALESRNIWHHSPVDSRMHAHKHEDTCSEDHRVKKRQRQRGPQRPSMVIKDWYLAHGSAAYPSSDELAALVTLSKLSKQQVQQCLNNLRARNKPSKHNSPTSEVIIT